MKSMKPDELFEYLDPNYKWVTKDKNGEVYIYKYKPNLKLLNTFEWNDSTLSFRMIPINIDFGTEDWKKCIAKRKPKIEVGMFGKFWKEGRENKIEYGYLKSINFNSIYNKTYYLMMDESCYSMDNFKPMTEPKELEE